nr:hypothetical protein [Subtercola lobariae]
MQLKAGALLGRNLNLAVEVQDPILDEPDLDSGHLAIGSPLVPAAADKIFVEGTVAIGSAVNDHARSALAAEKRALQIVIVLSFLLARCTV